MKVHKVQENIMVIMKIMVTFYLSNFNPHASKLTKKTVYTMLQHYRISLSVL